MPSGRIPKHQKPIYCEACKCDRPHLPDIGCVVCAARAATAGGLRLRPGVEPAYELEPDMEERRLEIRRADIEKKRAVCGGNSPGVAAIFLHAIRRDRRRRIFPKH